MAIDENLRHRAPLRTRHHLLALGRIRVDANFGVIQALLLQEVLGGQTIGAIGAAINFNFWHNLPVLGLQNRGMGRNRTISSVRDSLTAVLAITLTPPEYHNVHVWPRT